MIEIATYYVDKYMIFDSLPYDPCHKLHASERIARTDFIWRIVLVSKFLSAYLYHCGTILVQYPPFSSNVQIKRVLQSFWSEQASCGRGTFAFCFHNDRWICDTSFLALMRIFKICFTGKSVRSDAFLFSDLTVDWSFYHRPAWWNWIFIASLESTTRWCRSCSTSWVGFLVHKPAILWALIFDNLVHYPAMQLYAQPASVVLSLTRNFFSAGEPTLQRNWLRSHKWTWSIRPVRN